MNRARINNLQGLFRIPVWILVWSCIMGVACQEEAEPELVVSAAEPVLTRLTQVQYRNSIHDVLGADITIPPTLEPDTSIDGLQAIGSSLTSISPRGAELYEEAAQKIAMQVIGRGQNSAVLFPCEPSSETDSDCFSQITRAVGEAVWRRPLSEAEVEIFVDLALSAASTLSEPKQGTAYVLMGLLQSPNFLYRWEEGEVDPQSGALRYSDFEMASRLSYFIWGSGPDQELLQAAASGALTTDEGLGAEVQRMLSDDKSRRAVRDYFSQWLYLDELPKMSKDPNVFKHFSADLGLMARAETLGLVDHIVFESGQGLDDFFLSKTTFVNRRLAAIYNIPAVQDEGFGMVELSEEDPRRGYLGQVSFLALNAHPVSSSPTLRGVFVREHLLCDSVPPPPADLNTSIPEASAEARTVKERLNVHMEVEACAVCHSFIDPVGFGFENFDGIGMHRFTENGAQIDPSGAIDDLSYEDFPGLAQLLVDTPRLSECFVKKLYSYAVSRAPVSGEKELLADFTFDFDRRGRKVLELMEAIVMSPGFRLMKEVQP